MRKALQSNRHWSIISISLVLGMIFGNFLFPETSVVSAEETTENPQVSEIVDKAFSQLSSDDPKKRNKALIRLKMDLNTLHNRSRGQVKPSHNTRTEIASRLIALFKELDDVDDQTWSKTKKYIVQILARFGGTPLAEKFIAKVLNSETGELRKHALVSLGSLYDLYSNEFYEEIQGLIKKGTIPEKNKAHYLAVTRRKEAIPEILKIVRGTSDKDIFINASRTLQSFHLPEYMPEILKRIKELKLDKPQGQREQPDLFWIDRDQLKKCIEQSEGENLELALEISDMNHTLVNSEIIPILCEKVKNPRKRIRKLCLRLISTASQDPRANQLDIDKELESAFQREKDQKIKKDIQDLRKKLKKRRSRKNK